MLFANRQKAFEQQHSSRKRGKSSGLLAGHSTGSAKTSTVYTVLYGNIDRRAYNKGPPTDNIYSRRESCLQRFLPPENLRGTPYAGS